MARFKFKPRLEISVLALVAGAGAALAADLPDNGDKSAASWSGVYGGLIGGYSRGISSQRDIATGLGSNEYFTNGGIGGAGVGFNYQFGNWVIGLDADLSKSSISGSKAPGYFSRQDWAFLTRARFGYSLGDALVYIGLGPSYAGMTARGTLPNSGFVAGSQVRSGWSFSLGLDYMISPSLFARAEYTYICYGNEFLKNVDNVELMGHYARLGLYYKYDMPALRSAGAGGDEPSNAGLYDWSGFYFGPGIGGTAVSQTTAFSVAGVPTQSVRNSSAGGIRGWGLQGSVGFQAGANWRVGQFVAGVETDFHFSQLAGAGTSPHFSAAANGLQLNVVQNDNVEQQGTLRLRFGMPFDRWLIYATGGLAYGGLSSDSTLTTTAGTVTASHDSTRLGPVVGIGVERAVWGRWTARLEGMYAKFGDVAFSFQGPAQVGLITSKIGLSERILRVGFNLKLN